MPIEVTYQPGKVTVRLDGSDLEDGRYDGYVFGGGMCGVSGGWWKPEAAAYCKSVGVVGDTIDGNCESASRGRIEFPGYGVYKESIGDVKGWTSVIEDDVRLSNAGVGCADDKSEHCITAGGCGGREPSDSSSSVIGKTRGKWYYHNKAKRERKRRERKFDCEAGSELDRGVVGDLQVSLEGKWKAENDLRKFEAERKLRLLQAQEEDTLVRMQRAQVLRTTETCKVQTEKAFSTLKKTGNVAGFAETVVSDPSLTEGSSARSSGDCISPDSSVSQQEIRRMQQENLEMQRYMEKVKLTDPKVHAHALRIAGEKSAYTMDTEGEIAVDAIGELREDGKIHVSVGSRLLANASYKQKYRELEEEEW